MTLPNFWREKKPDGFVCRCWGVFCKCFTWHDDLKKKTNTKGEEHTLSRFGSHLRSNRSTFRFLRKTINVINKKILYKNAIIKRKVVPARWKTTTNRFALGLRVESFQNHLGIFVGLSFHHLFKLRRQTWFSLWGSKTFALTEERPVASFSQFRK